MNDTLQTLCKLIQWLNQQGWSPATSTNYSHRCPVNPDHVYVSRSGVDKSLFRSDDFIIMDLDGKKLPDQEAIKPSAETGIHLMLYQQTDAHVVLHTHSKADTLLSRIFAAQDGFQLENYELLKGLRNIETHQARSLVPIFQNDQDISRMSQHMAQYLSTHPDCQGMLIESHGFYTWGRNLEEAKRHIEVFQFLFDCELELLKLNAGTFR